MSHPAKVGTRSSDRLFVSVEEAARMLGVSRTLAYALAREFLTNGVTGLPCVRVGSRRIVVPRRVIEDLSSGVAAPIARPTDAA